MLVGLPSLLTIRYNFSMMKWLKGCLFLTLLLSAWAAQAFYQSYFFGPHTHRFGWRHPHETALVHFKNGYLILRGKQEPVVFQIHNVSGQDTVIDFAKHNGTAQAGLASEVQADHYSALWHSRGVLKLACYSTDQPRQRVDCQQMLAVVPAPQVGTSSQAGEYWVIENTSKTLMCSKMADQGVQA